MYLKRIILIFIGGLLIYSCSIVKNSDKNNKRSLGSNAEKATTNINTNQDSSKKGIKPYKEIITRNAISHKGLLTVHRINDKYYFEIPDSLINKDILIINRISKGAAIPTPFIDQFGYGGDEINENVVRFTKESNLKIYMRRIYFTNRSSDTTNNGMYKSIQNSSIQPIVEAFDIKAFSADSSSVIEVTKLLNSDDDILNFDPFLKKMYGLAAIQPDKSYIEDVKAFPLNVEIRTEKTYLSQLGQPKTFELNSSIILLPKIQMTPRFVDNRVGYFFHRYVDFDADPQSVKVTGMIDRWKIEPKAEDINKYLQGHLVEPKTPIVFYIDPATPKKWVPYLRKGVEDWQKAFEKAGFKNAIYVKEVPLDDSTWSLDDARHNVIVYKSSALSNANGPHVVDPRTGEILETHINWYHNVMELIHDWCMVQVGPSDTRARKMEFDDELMGKLIRFVCCHEVGHTLGLAHNFGASSTVNVDSLRNKAWVEKNGFCPSIMDYARFNYVAQPEDSISEDGLFPRIGEYDKWAIEFGYRWFPHFHSKEDEKEFMNKWVIGRLNSNKKLWFGGEYYLTNDPRIQAEDIGDNAMLAGYYGIKNLKRVTLQLIDWTNQPNEDYSDLERMQSQVNAQYYRYLIHVVNNIGGVLNNFKTREQPGNMLEFTGREKQRSAVRFLQTELFDTPTWILNKKIYFLTGNPGPYGLMDIQKHVLQQVMAQSKFYNLLCFEASSGKNAYSPSELLNDIEKAIWSELNTAKRIDIYRSNLQKIYIEQLITCLHFKNSASSNDQAYANANSSSEIHSVLKADARNLLNKITRALPTYKDQFTRDHLMDLRDQLKNALTPNGNFNENSTGANGDLNINNNQFKNFGIRYGDNELDF